jgi:glycosyltransferase involved in cell wall biosynthesis
LRDLLADGETGYVVDRIGVSMAAGLRRFGSLPESRRQQMATAARAAAQRYGLDAFVAGWAKLYAGLEA